MDGGFGDKIREILNDPEAMAKISQIASGLSPPASSATSAASIPETPNKANSQPVSALGSLPLPSGDRRLALLSSIRPLLREDKQKKIDNLKTAFTIATIIGNYKKRT